MSFSSFQLNEFLQSEVRQKLSSVHKIPCIAAITDRGIMSIYRASGLLCSPPQSVVQIK